VIRHTQTITAERPDGHNAEGIPGDCFRTAVASMLDLAIEDVPHFMVFADWWGAARRWARERGGDFAYLPIPVPEYGEEAWAVMQDWTRDHPDAKVILSGPSPRGPFWHAVVGDTHLETHHDPHPSRAGLLEVGEVTYYCQPYWPPPYIRELMPA